MKRNQKGFSAIELLLVILIVVIVVFGGYYVWHTNHDKNKPISNTTLTLQQAVSATKTVYGSLISSWNNEPEITFIDNNSAWFTSSFIQSTESPKTNNNGLPLVCGGNGVTIPNSVQYTGISAVGSQSIVKVTFVYSGVNEANANWLVTLTAHNNKWLVDSLACPN
jgi:prepilin-type N-terminal cleavage/methylation domain-containing protein